MFFQDVIDVNETNLFREYPEVLQTLLGDRTAGRNLLWCTEDYAQLGEGYQADAEMLPELITVSNEGIIKSRCMKDRETQIRRIRAKGEVFTPSWLCNKMNNVIDREWFGREIVFNREEEKGWKRVHHPKGFMPFPDKKPKEAKSWQNYIKLKRLEITCGEAPYLCSRYDMVTGDGIIALMNRIGFLDRKMQVIHQRVKVGNKANWLRYAKKALQSVYGYDWQGDNVLLARENLLMTVIAFYQYKFHEDPEPEVVQEWAEIIAWNIWQMDGLKYVIPNSCHKVPVSCGLEGFCDDCEREMEPCPGCKRHRYNEHTGIYCKIMDWEKGEVFEFKDLVKEGGMMPKKADFKFDVIIGNPPYQDVTIGDNETYQPSVYHLFLEAAYSVADVVEMVHPARFLFNAGSTPKDWNKKMLNDEHLKVVIYNADSKDVFGGTEIKGGVVVTYHNNTISYTPIGTFTTHDILNDILLKVCNSNKNFESFSKIVGKRNQYSFSKKLLHDHPEVVNKQSEGHADDLTSNVFDNLDIILTDAPEKGYENIRIIGRQNNQRIYKFIRTEYMNYDSAFDKYKVFMPQSSGSGGLGEVMAPSVVGYPSEASTETFLTVGLYDNEEEAKSTLKYIKTKFARIMLSIMKSTQANTSQKWAKVPLQDFTSNSDIDWSKSVAEIDQQLYKKYGLSKEEIEFIESHVKEMV